jgi:hypothetical protein
VGASSRCPGAGSERPPSQCRWGRPDTPSGKVGSSLGGALYSLLVLRAPRPMHPIPWARCRPLRGAAGADSVLTGPAVQHNHALARAAPEPSWGSLTKWSLPTRLETRTKESNNFASIRVANPGCAINVKACDRCGGVKASCRAAGTGPDTFRGDRVRVKLLGPERR